MVTRRRWRATPMLNEQGETVYTTRSDVRPHLARMRAIRRSAMLTSSERLVLLIIEEHADNVTGFAYPGVALIVRETALSKRTVLSAIHSAADKGWLRIMPGKSPLDPRGNGYRLTPVQGDDFDDEGEGPVSG